MEHRVLLVLVVVGVAGIVLGWALGRARVGRAWLVRAIGNLAFQVGALIVLVGVAVDGFRRGGYFLALAIPFGLLALVLFLFYVFLGVAAFGGEPFVEWLRRRSRRARPPEPRPERTMGGVGWAV